MSSEPDSPAVEPAAPAPPEEASPAVATPSSGARLPGYIELRAAEFARQQPPGTPASEVVALAQERGLTLEIADVYRIRERDRQRQASTPPKEQAMVPVDGSSEPSVTDEPASQPEKRRGRRPGGAETKAGFVRSLPASVSAKEVVEQAKERGFEISEGYVYAIRSKLKEKPAKPAVVTGKRGRKPKEAPPPEPKAALVEKKRRGRPPSAAAPAEKRKVSPGKATTTEVKEGEVKFAKLVLQIGLLRAEQLMVQLKGKLADLW